MGDETTVTECKCRYFVPEGRAVCISCKKTTDETQLEWYRNAFNELLAFIRTSRGHEANDFNCGTDMSESGCKACDSDEREAALLTKYEGK